MPYQRDYASSPELKEIYSTLYPQNDFEEFISRAASPTNLDIHDPAPNPQHQPHHQQEIDFPLRQFLWFIRPAPDFIAFMDFVDSWKKLRNQAKQANLEQQLPWESIDQVITLIQKLILKHIEDHSQSPLFPNQFADKKYDGIRLKNPMVRHSASDYPLYTLFLEHPDNKESTDDLRELFNKTITYVLIREAEQRKISATKKHPRYRNPYQFLKALSTDPKEPGLEPLCNVERAIRLWSDKLIGSSFETIISKHLISETYEEFLQTCHRLKISAQPVNDNRYWDAFLNFFALARQSHHSSSGKRSSPKKPLGQGGHYWQSFYDDHHFEVDIYDQTAEEITTIQELLPEQLSEAREAGEDPYEDTIDETQVELICLEDALASQLKLNQHTSHQQQLISTLNQRIWWSQTDFSHEDMLIFYAFLQSRPEIASTVLQIVLLTGVDLDMALQTHIKPIIKDAQWIRGGTDTPFGFKESPNHVVMTQIIENQEIVPIWSLPIKTIAFKESINVVKSDTYQAHTSHIAFRDQSGLIVQLFNQQPLDQDPSAFQLFSDIPNLKEECLQLLHDFNEQFNCYATRPLEKRRLSIKKMRDFYQSRFLREHVDSSMIDWLNWHTPFVQTPTLHYYAQQLHEKVSQKTNQHSVQNIGLQYALSNLTGLFQGKNNPHLPPTHKLSVGAPELLKVKVFKNWIKDLQDSINRSYEDITTASYGAFIESINNYGYYMMLWFCCETSHRPHHTPYADIDEVDPLHGIIKLKDKSPVGGEKYRLSFVSKELRDAMRSYANTLHHFNDYLHKFGYGFENHHQCMFIQASADSLNDQRRKPHIKHPHDFQVMDAKYFRQWINQQFNNTIAPNFYRKMMVSLFKEKNLPFEDIKHWLGHSVHGTAPYNEFSSSNHLAYCHRMKNVLPAIIQELGFKDVKLKLPRRPTQKVQEK